HPFLGGESGTPALPELPISRSEMFDEQFHLVSSEGGEPLPNQPYRITASDGQVWEGISDADGLTERVYTRQSVDLSVEVLPHDHDGETIT
ncbi:hypothetical protein, partial [Frateuria sp. Soil773]|uniref:hypothetical protein n=1 Tax=Frateuria sp. Soil773 TaxID=1736407 RepID=UPI00138F5726